MFAMMWLSQATMAAMATAWFKFYKPSTMNPQLSVYVSKVL